MKTTEIRQKEWKISPKLEVFGLRVSNLEPVEQECNINILKVGYDSKEPQTIIECSYQKWITKLSHNPNFILQSLTESKSADNYGYVLSVRGLINNKAISLRRRDYSTKTTKGKNGTNS